MAILQVLRWKNNVSVSSAFLSNRLPKTKHQVTRSLNALTQRPPLEEPSSFPDWSFESRDFFRYELIYQSKKSNARVGRIHTPHGIIDTPGYVAVATNGALKGLDFREADEAGQQLVFCNSYHLLLQPGPEVIEGKHQFCLFECFFIHKYEYL